MIEQEPDSRHLLVVPQIESLHGFRAAAARFGAATLAAVGASLYAIGGANAQEIPVSGISSEASAQEVSEPKKCTYNRFDAKYVNKSGPLCAEDGVEAAIVGNGYKRRGWVLAVVYLGKGVAQCGFIMPGKLPERKPKKGHFSACRKLRLPLINRKFIKDPNCGDINGVDACESGTWHSPVNTDNTSCPTAGIVYSAFVTKHKSAWNLDGVKSEPFIRPLNTVPHSKLSYRARYDIPGESRSALAVRTEGQWAVAPTCSIKPEYRYGGTCKDKNRNRNEHDQVVCGRQSTVRKYARGKNGWRNKANTGRR